MKIMLTAMAAGLAVSSAALATPSTGFESQTLSYGFQLSPGGATLDFAKFDTSTSNPNVTRILQKVTITLNADVGANVTAENDNIDPADFFGVNLTGVVTLDIGGLGANTFVLQNATAPGGVAGSDGVPGSGPDFYDFGFVSGSDSDMEMTFDDALLANFVGPGSITANLFGSGGFAVSGASNATLVISDFGASGSVTIEYAYKLIPSPGSAALIGLAGVVVAGRRRR
ncbi:MAG: choice-of-anchor E domain-containing protein [Phycisphaerales bacterium]|nr:choice-of-anchor E domain-containing protein [Phycisphaerales bacterium]